MNSQDRLIRIVLLCLLVYSAACLFSTSRELKRAQAVETELSHKLKAMRKENLCMAQRLEDGLSDEQLQQLARQRLGLVMPGEKIFYFTTDREA